MNSLIASKTFFILFAQIIGIYYILSLFGFPSRKILYSGGSSNIPENCNQFTEGVLEESDAKNDSWEHCWWLNSGGIFYVEDGIGQTLQNDIPAQSPWKTLYRKNNPVDTDQGLHPQNIFRLINTEVWGDVDVSLFFQIENYHLSRSPNRNMSNGVLLMSRYLDGDNLYYAGMRVDGTAVIKKKINGVYTTLASSTFIDNKNYDHYSNPILLPTQKWIGEKLIAKNIDPTKVELQFFIDFTDSGEWKLVLDVVDSETLSGTKPIVSSGNVGIRTDFMDVKFKNFSAMSP